MQKVITKYGLAAHLALAAVAPLFLSPVAVVCLAALAAVWFVMEPSRIGGEMLHDARRRCRKATVRDPLFWVLAILVLIAGVRALNGGVGLAYDAETAKWFLAKPAVEVLPGSVTGRGFEHFALVVAIWVVVTGCRQALGRSARFVFVLCLSVLVAVGQLSSVLMLREDPAAFEQAVTCSLADPQYAGSVAGVAFVLALVALETVFERRWWRALPFVAIAIIGSSVGAFLFAPPVVCALYAVVALLVLAYIFVYLRLKISGSADFKLLAVSGMGLALSVMIVMSLLTEAELSAKVDPILEGVLFPEGFQAQRETLSATAFRIWTGGPWLGEGLGAFPLSLKFAATAADWSVISPLQTLPLNGYWLLLTERGVVGAFLLLVPVALLLVSFVSRLIGGIRVLPHPLCWAGPILLIAVLVETMGDCSFMTTGALLPVLAVFALSVNAFSKETQSNG